MRDRDDDLRASCFGQLAILCAEHGEDVPYAGGLGRGFSFRGQRVPYLNRQQGIFRAAAQRGPAALSVQTSANTPYSDHETPDGIVYAYRGRDPDHRDNQALRSAYELQTPVVYFAATRPGWYRPVFPCYVADDDPDALCVLLQPGAMRGSPDEPEPTPIGDPVERRYVLRQTRARLHQGRFRGLVLPAYRDRCAVCRLRELRLLDAAHIVADADPAGVPVVVNGLSLCSIHHRAYDEHLVGITPDYEVRVSRRLLDDEDGPMLDLLKGFDRQRIHVPSRTAWRPDRERLARRFERFRETA